MVIQAIWDFFSSNYLQIIDILAVSTLFYYLFLYVRGTRTVLIIQGLVLLGLFYSLCQYFNLITLVFIMKGVLVAGPLALVLVFAPEIRRVLERAGRTSRLFDWAFSRDQNPGATTPLLDVLVTTVFELSRARVGALIIIERSELVSRHIVPGTELQALPSERFLLSLFNRHNPLHDGAVLLTGDRVHSAGNFLPISESIYLTKDLGTRHRAAIGLTERCDAVVIVVSEERGHVSIAYHGRLARRLTEQQFEEQLSALVEPNPTFASIVPRAAAI